MATRGNLAHLHEQILRSLLVYYLPVSINASRGYCFSKYVYLEHASFLSLRSSSLLKTNGNYLSKYPVSAVTLQVSKISELNYRGYWYIHGI